MPPSEIRPDSAAAAPRTRLDGDSLRAALAAELGIDAAELGDDTSLLELGFDSMRLMAWLNRLRSDGYALTMRDLYREPTPAGWRQLLQHPPAPPAEPDPAPRHWPTMRDGDGVADALYSDNPAIDCLNRGAAQIARALAAPHDGLAVLEVGAGTAATTRHLLPALEGRLQGYRFTDVSPLFLDDARRRFAGHAALDYALFDINAAVDFDAHPEAGYDLAVAVNVLHDARDAVASLRRIGRLLKPDGRLLMIEATERSSMLQLASIGFIEGLNGYDDQRTVDDKPMLDLPMWRDALARAGFSVELVWPDAERSPLRQHLVLARAEHGGRLDLPTLAGELRARFGNALPPVRMRQCEHIDRYAPLRTGPAAGPDPRDEGGDPLMAAPGRAAPPPAQQAALEREVGALWRTLLDRDVSGDSDFFQCGGDSLIATRMVAQLSRSGVRGANLQALFAARTLAAFCATLAAPAAADAANPADCIVPLAAGEAADEVFVFHASDGELAAYLPLARQLGCRVHGLRATDAPLPDSLDALATHYAQAIRATRKQGLCTLVGWSFGAFTAAAAARVLHEAGDTVELVLLDPVCRDDFRHGDRASLLRLLDQGRGGLTLPESFGELDTDAQLACFTQAAREAGLLPAAAGTDDARRWLQRAGELLALLTRHHAPVPLPIRCLWLTAERRPAHWQPGEADWHDWQARAERHTLDADHWSLVLDETSAVKVATLIRQWRQQAHSSSEAS